MNRIIHRAPAWTDKLLKVAHALAINTVKGLVLSHPDHYELDDPDALFVAYTTDTTLYLNDRRIPGVIVEIQDGEGWCPKVEIFNDNGRLTASYIGD